MKLRTTLCWLVLGCAAACGRTATLDFQNGETDNGRGARSGAHASGGSSIDAGTAVGGSAGRAGSSTDAGTAVGGSAGSAGFGGSSGAADAGPVDPCKLPTPTPSTPDEQERDDLIRSFCSAIANGRCTVVGSVSSQVAGCDSAEDRLRLCIIDTYYDYAGQIKTPECNALWRTAITCAAGVDYRVEGCKQPLQPTEVWGGDPPRPCDAEKEALTPCLHARQGRASGSRGDCFYGWDPFNASGCRVDCEIGSNYFRASCAGPPGLPVSCECMLNEHVLWDDGDGFPANFIAADCRAAAAQMAEGRCIDRVDCCFAWSGPETAPTQHCSCTSDPKKLGHETCAAVAEARGGQVVGLCPQYKHNPGCIPSIHLPCH